MSRIDLCIKDWTVWLETPAAETINSAINTSQLPLIPAMLRRRLGDQGKRVVSACDRLLQENTHLPLVFCSRHGEIQRSIEILSALADGEGTSPMQFSLSVHNAISGMISIATGNQSAITAMGAGPESIAAALTESSMILQDAGSQHHQVLCVIYDSPLPELYSGAGIGPQQPYVLALLLDRVQGERLSLHYARASQSDTPETDSTMEDQIAALCALLAGETDQAQCGPVLIQRSRPEP